MEKYTLELVSFMAMLAEKTTTRYEWACYFTLKNDPTNYRSIVFLEEYENSEFGWFWDYSVPEILLENDKWEHTQGSSVHDIVFHNWTDHLFTQFIQLIKRHSKDRLRLIPYNDIEYFEEDFTPLPSYHQPESIKFIENI